MEENSTVAFFATVQNEGGRSTERKIAYYNLDVIISVDFYSIEESRKYSDKFLLAVVN